MLKNGKTLFGDNWQFTLKEIGTSLDEINSEKDWHDVEIPHDWLIGDTRNLYKTGEGWYKKSFTLDKGDLDGKLFICFDGVYMNSAVYLNGKEIGVWKYGYSSFYFDMTSAAEGENTLLVRVQHEAPNTRWYSGAGIYRNVYIKKTPLVHVAENGIYIVTDGKSRTHVETEIINESENTEKIELVHEIIDNNGRTVVFSHNNLTLKAGETLTDNQDTLVYHPAIWDTQNPNLYTLKTTISIGEEIIQTETNRYGYRKTEFSPSEGFKLNGRQLKLHGVCMHHDLGALGAAVNYEALKRQMTILRLMGVNAIRTSHNMPAPELCEICDEMGILMDNEAFDMWEMPKNKNDYARFFPEWYKTDVASWVRRDRNHPCVIMWSIGNEIADTHASPRGLEVAKMLKTEVIKHDPYENAIATIGSNYMTWENGQKVADYLKQGGYNYTENLYDAHHAAHPDWFIYGSETASTVRSRGIYHFPADTAILMHDDLQCSDMGNSVVGWGRSHESAWIMDRDRDYVGGQFIWTGFDYIGEPTPYSTKNSYFGIIDTAGIPKDAFYLYKAVWTDGNKSPFIHIMPYWDWNDGQEIQVYTYSNVEDVELFFNGKSLGKQHIDLLHGDVLHGSWTLPYEKGTLTAKAYADGAAVAEKTISSFGEAEKLVTKTNKEILRADGRDMIFLEVIAADKDNNPVANARNRIEISVKGAGRLVGMDNGDSTDYDSYKGNSRRLFSGKLIAMIEATFESGDIEVEITSKGLEKSALKFRALPCEKPVGVSVAPCYPVYIQPDVDEIPVRKIELTAPATALDENNKTVMVTAKTLPENASYSDIAWKCVLPNGVVTPIAEAAAAENGALVTAKGDGEFILRAMCKNGKDNPEIISDLTFAAKGLGDALISPYKFISAALYAFANTDLKVVERGSISGIEGRTVIGFDNIDFGTFGSNKLTLYFGNSWNEPLPVEIWLGDPNNGGRMLEKTSFAPNGRWDGFDPEEFVLPERISGLQSIAFVVERQCIFGGFEFTKTEKAYEKLTPVQNDGLYGDEYSIAGGKIENIGNNVLIEFHDMDFGSGTTSITICGRTPKDKNTIQLRYTPCGGGQQQTQLLDFKHSDEYTEMKFTLDAISGKNDISFVFLPGCKFDFDWFKFE